MSADYQWTSNANSDPFFAQRLTMNKRKANQRHAAEIAAVQKKIQTANPDKPVLPEYLRAGKVRYM